MTEGDARDLMVAHWVQQADESLATARWAHGQGFHAIAAGRAYFACFHIVSAVLLTRGQVYAKHTAVREALHRDLVRLGQVTVQDGRLFDDLFKARHRGDYDALSEFEEPDVAAMVEDATGFVERLRLLLDGV